MSKKKTKERRSEIVVVGRAENTGLGSMAEDFCRNMDADAILVNTHARKIYRDRLSIVGEIDTHKQPLTPAQVVDLIEGYKYVVFFETFYQPMLFMMADELGVKTVGFPMWEWSPPHFDVLKVLIALDEPTMRTYPAAVRLDWPIDLSAIEPGGPVQLPPKRFAHNYGNMGVNHRNGTQSVLAASYSVYGSGAKLAIRGYESLQPNWSFDPQAVTFVMTTESRSGLYANNDVMILAPRFEGLYLGILEPTALGIPVITSDLPCFRHYPHRVPVKEAGSFKANNGTEVPLFDADADALGEMIIEMSRGNISIGLPEERYRPPTWEAFKKQWKLFVEAK